MSRPQDHHQSANRVQVRPLYKIIFYIAAWLAALFATNPSAGYRAMAYLFPLGLAAFVNLRWGNNGGWWALGIGIGIYLVHAVLFFRSKTARSTLILSGFLVVLLICNVAGCRAQLPR
jgi:hypothetical protein